MLTWLLLVQFLSAGEEDAGDSSDDEVKCIFTTALGTLLNMLADKYNKRKSKHARHF